MLRASTVDAIRQQLSIPPYLLPDDFSITYEKGKYSLKVTLELTTGDASFTASIPQSKAEREKGAREDFRITCVLNPGEITNHQEIEIWGLENLKSAVAEWARRIADDFSRAPVMRAMAKEAERVQVLEEKLEGLPDEATPEQIEKLQQLLTDVETQLKEKLERLQISDKQKQERLDQLSAEFAFMKDRLEGTSIKKAWRAIASRLQRIAADPQTATMLESGSKLLQLTGNVVDILK